MPRKKKEIPQIATETVIEELETEEVSEPEFVFKKPKSDRGSLIYYFSVVGHINDEGDEIKYSFPSMNNDFNCEWDLMSIIDRSALKFYLANDEYKTLDKWPLTFKYYKNLKSKAECEVEVELAYCPVFSQHIKTND